MIERPGVQTKYFGKWLTGYIRGIPVLRDCSVYYRDNTRNSATSVDTINGISGLGDNTTNVDALVAKSNGEVVLLIEIKASGLKPRKAIVDIFSFLMCERFCVEGSGRSHCYPVTSETKLILAGAQINDGKNSYPSRELILSTIRRSDGARDRLRSRNISIVAAQSNFVLGYLKIEIERLYPRF